MRKPTDKFSPVAEEIYQQIQAQKKKRSDAVARLKACAAQTENAETSSEAPSVSHINGEVSQSTCPRERALEARRARKEGLAALKRTTVLAVKTIRETTLYSAAELRKRLDDEHKSSENKATP